MPDRLLPDSSDPGLNELQRTEAPIPAVSLTMQELKNLGLLDSNEPPAEADRPSGKIQAFVEKVLPAAQYAAEELNVPVEAVISQWALESGWGQSTLASKYNNLGGIKAFSSWKGEKVDMPTFEEDRSKKIVQPFRVYRDLNDYAHDYTNILNHPRYTLARGTNDVSSFGLALGKAGYHADRPEAYASQLASIANRIKPFLPSSQPE